MMSPDNMPAAKPPPPQQQQQTAGLKDENQGSSSGRKTASTTRPPPEQILKCPRCDSPNTKFCYYNNYSLTQPRHFCKTCRRYWTKGGALRNVPIGGGCRKNKKVKSCSSSSSRLSGGSDSRDSSSCSDIGGGLKFFHGISPAMDFQLGGLSIPRLQTSTTAGIYNYNYNLPLSSFGDSISNNASSSSSSSSCFNLEYQSAAGTSNSLMGFNYPLSLATGSGGGGSNFNGAIQSSMNVHSSLASSIESLSCINQDLHWKLQQQRLSMLFGGGGGGDLMTTQKDVNAASSSSLTLLGNQTTQKSSPPSSSQILFRNLDVSKPHEVYAGSTTTALQPQARKEVSRSGDNTAATEWFFGNSYAPPPPVTPTPTNSNSNGNENGNNWNGFQAWNDLQQYSALP